MIMDESIVKRIIQKKKYCNEKSPQYFQLETQPFIHEKWFPNYFKDKWNIEYNNGLKC